MRQVRDVILEMRGVNKTFKDFWLRPRVKAVQEMNLTVRRGEVIGLLGPNVLLAHVLGIDEAEVDCLARTGSSVVMCPSTAAKEGRGVPEHGKMPLLLDREVSVEAAVYASWRVVLENPVPMAVWAGLLMLLTAAGMALGMIGLVVVVPVLAHASWHAYRDLVGLRA